MDQKGDYLILAYYLFPQIDNPTIEVDVQKEFLLSLQAKGRIYIAENGINGTLSASIDSANKYMEWIRSRFSGIEVDFKQHVYHTHAFSRLIVKVKRELVSFGADVDLNKRGEYLTPKQWKQALAERDENTILLDVRNDYEWNVGRFENSEILPCNNFRQFKDAVDALKSRVHAQTKILTCCTGGIRCEIFTAYMNQIGFNNVYHLKGGILNYGKEVGDDFWEGKVYVFDDRMAIPIAEDSTSKVVGSCLHCQTSHDRYYNCANMDCNELFISCSSCLEKYKGCCCIDCQTAKRVRPFKYSNEPFRKWYHYASKKEELNTLSQKMQPQEKR